MYGAEYVWILQETHGEPWWLNPTVECSRKDLEKAAESLIIVGSHNSIVGSEISYSGLVYIKNKMIYTVNIVSVNQLLFVQLFLMNFHEVLHLDIDFIENFLQCTQFQLIKITFYIF